MSSFTLDIKNKSKNTVKFTLKTNLNYKIVKILPNNNYTITSYLSQDELIINTQKWKYRGQIPMCVNIIIDKNELLIDNEKHNVLNKNFIQQALGLVYF